MQVLQVQLAVQADPAEVGRARRWVLSRLLNHGLDPDAPVAETVVLVVSELVTNAVVHTGCPAVLRLCLPVEEDPAAGEPPGPLRVEVADASQAAPAPRHAGADEDATNGRGLELVELLCERWGWYPDGSGKRVWCEIGAEARSADPLAGVDWAALAQ
ncbi:ATP-binding protein [Kitasatospora sp. NPDC087314]|uniref:ATP-binding protein n=1 Tax=Kitasatospora sp. NPDC087314 TaxID=3364068 RepID=UPI003801821C